MAKTPLVFLWASALAPASSWDGYGHGISKSTYAASDPLGTFQFLARHFPVHCQDALTPCNESFTCGTSGRAVLCNDASCSYNHFSAFGLHTVNMSARPDGGMGVDDVEAHFFKKLRHGFRGGAYDSFMDFSVVVFSTSLDSYVASFTTDGVPSLLLHWQDDEGQSWYSLLVQMARSQLVLEIVSSHPPTADVMMVEDSLQRLPAALFKANAVANIPASDKLLRPLAVSRATSDLAAVEQFYVKDLLASVRHSHSTVEGVKLRTFDLPGADAQMRFTERPSTATFGSFTVKDLELVKHRAHEIALSSPFCGVDKWIDNHVAYDQNQTALDVFKANFDKHGRKYHIFGDCSSAKLGPGTNMYVVDPTGDSVQVDGHWNHCPKGGSGDALLNPCSQGNCTAFIARASCTAALLRTCPSLGSKNTSCTDCAYRRWIALEESGCRNADIVNFCLSGRGLSAEAAFAV